MIDIQRLHVRYAKGEEEERCRQILAELQAKSILRAARKSSRKSRKALDNCCQFSLYVYNAA